MLLKSGLFFTLCLFTLQASQIKGKNPVGRLGLLLTYKWDFSFSYCLGIMIAERCCFKKDWLTAHITLSLVDDKLSFGVKTFLQVFHQWGSTAWDRRLKETLIHFKGNRVFQFEVCIWLCYLKTSLCKLQNASSSSNRSLVFRKMSSTQQATIKVMNIHYELWAETYNGCSLRKIASFHQW